MNIPEFGPPLYNGQIFPFPMVETSEGLYSIISWTVTLWVMNFWTQIRSCLYCWQGGAISNLVIVFDNNILFYISCCSQSITHQQTCVYVVKATRQTVVKTWVLWSFSCNGITLNSHGPCSWCYQKGTFSIPNLDRRYISNRHILPYRWLYTKICRLHPLSWTLMVFMHNRAVL